MFPNYLDGATILTIAHLADNSENEFVKKTFAMINKQPRRKRRGTVLNVSHCVFYKVVAVSFNPLYYDAKRRGIKPSYNKVIELSCIIWVK